MALLPSRSRTDWGRRVGRCDLMSATASSRIVFPDPGPHIGTYHPHPPLFFVYIYVCCRDILYRGIADVYTLSSCWSLSVCVCVCVVIDIVAIDVNHHQLLELSCSLPLFIIVLSFMLVFGEELLPPCKHTSLSSSLCCCPYRYCRHCHRRREIVIFLQLSRCSVCLCGLVVWSHHRHPCWWWWCHWCHTAAMARSP